MADFTSIPETASEEESASDFDENPSFVRGPLPPQSPDAGLREFLQEKFDDAQAENEYLKRLVLELHGDRKKLVLTNPDAWAYDMDDSGIDSEVLDGSDSEFEVLTGQPNDAPEGPIVAMLFTDVEKSTMMQKTFLNRYDFVQDMHDKCLEDAIYANNGYVVNKVGDLYFAVFSESSDAIQAACGLQENLFNADWPDYFVQTPLPKPFAGTPNELFKGIRVRVGVHIAECDAEVNPFDGAPENLIFKPNMVLAVDYQGNAVSMAERIMDIGAGGQILITGAAHKAAEKFLEEQGDNFDVIDLGVQPIKGLRDIQVYEVQPKSLKGRIFPDLSQKEKESHQRITHIRELLTEVEDVMDIAQQRTKDADRAKKIRETSLTINNIISECRELKKELMKRTRMKREGRLIRQRSFAEPKVRTRERFAVAKKLGPRDIGTVNSSNWSPAKYSIMDSEEFLAERLVSFRGKRKSEKIHKAGPREIGYIQNWTPAKYELSDTGEFLAIRTSSTHRKPVEKVEKKLGPRDIGFVSETEWTPAQFDIDTKGEFLDPRVSAQSRSPKTPVERKLGPREIGKIDEGTWTPPSYDLPEDDGDWLAARSARSITPKGRVEKKIGPRDVDKTHKDWSPAEYDIATDDSCFLKPRLSVTSLAESPPSAMHYQESLKKSDSTRSRTTSALSPKGNTETKTLQTSKSEDSGKKAKASSAKEFLAKKREQQQQKSQAVTRAQSLRVNKKASSASRKFLVSRTHSGGPRVLRKSSEPIPKRIDDPETIRKSSLESAQRTMKHSSPRQKLVQNTGKTSDPAIRRRRKWGLRRKGDQAVGGGGKQNQRSEQKALGHSLQFVRSNLKDFHETEELLHSYLKFS